MRCAVSMAAAGSRSSLLRPCELRRDAATHVGVRSLETDWYLNMRSNEDEDCTGSEQSEPDLNLAHF